MRIRRTPRTASFATAFGELAEQVRVGALAVQDSLGPASHTRRTDLDRLRQIERDGLRVRDEIVALARDSFVTPFDRGDIHLLAVRLTECLSHMEQAVDAGVRHRIDEFPEGTAALVDALVRMAELTARALATLSSPDGAGDYPGEIRRIASRAEPIRRDLTTQNLSGSDPLGALRTAAVLDGLGLTLRSFEQVATVVEGIVVKES